jgi:uncharacterized protein (TIGR03546 family)
MFWLEFFKKLIRILNADVAPGEIAGGMALGSIIGFSPFFCLHNIVVALLILLIRVNISTAIFSSVIFGLIGYLIDPIADSLGYYFLVEVDPLIPYWTKLYNLPIVPFFEFNNTVVLGSLVISILLLLPIFLLTRIGVISYRKSLKEKIEKMRIVKIIKANKLYQWYAKIRSID